MVKHFLCLARLIKSDTPSSPGKIQNKQKKPCKVVFATVWIFLFRKGTPGPSELATPPSREIVPPLDCLMRWVVVRQRLVQFLTTPRTYVEEIPCEARKSAGKSSL